MRQSFSFKTRLNAARKSGKPGDCLSYIFSAMASPCEILIDSQNKKLAKRIFNIVETEAKRIESKFSRYNEDGVVCSINHSNGEKILLDDETCHLVAFANECFSLSEGLFDVSSGVLGKLWKFHQKDFELPTPLAIKKQLKHIGWDKVVWKKPEISIPEGMQVDFGGIGKEYAVDRCFLLAKQACQESFLINFGGDMITNGRRKNDRGWIVGVEDASLKSNQPLKIIELSQGALATSGNTKRFIAKDSKTYGHILNPKTGYPVQGAPRSISVAADSCLEAGMLSTFSMLVGRDAQKFIEQQDVEYWLQW